MRFALAALFFGSAAIAADNSPTAAEQKTIDWIEKAGGEGQIDGKLPPEARVAVRFDSANDAILLALRKQQRIGALEILDATSCTAKGFSALKEMPHLRKLTLGKSKVKAASASAIGQCVGLRHLGLNESGITDVELPALKKLTRLEHLTLTNNPKITDKGMQTVKGFERLQALYLGNTALTDKGLAELRGLDGLRTLNLANTKVTADAAEKFVDEMPNLRVIRR